MEEKTAVSKVGRVIKITFTVALFVFIGALIFRMCQASYQALEETHISAEFKKAYKVSTNVRTHAVNDEFSENGAVYAYSLVYIEEAGYLQFTVRYNRLHIEEVQESFKDFKHEDIEYELVDGNGKTYAPRTLAHDEASYYHYFKLEFTNVDFSTNSLSVKMLLNGIDINVGEKSTLVIHKKSDTSIPYSLTSEDKEKLGIE